VRAKPDEIDARTDVYSLGVILYEILTGASPYPEATQIVEILHHITETSPRLPMRAWDSSTGISRRDARQRTLSTKCPIDGDLETIVLKAITKEPERRYASAQSFADDLNRYLDGRPIEARRDSGIYILKKKLRRNRRVVLLYIAAIAVAAIGIFWARRPGPEPVAQLDPESIARYEAAQTDYTQVRSELMALLESRAADGVPLDPLTQDSLRIIQDAVKELQTAIENDPGNRALRELLLKTYHREIDLIKRVAAMPPTP
jgi:serine/threonine protein kinase